MERGFYFIKHNSPGVFPGGKREDNGIKSVIFVTNIKTNNSYRGDEFMYYNYNNDLEKFQVGVYHKVKDTKFLRKLENKEIIEYFFKSKSYGKKFIKEIKRL